jgi:hypothetical protein
VVVGALVRRREPRHLLSKNLTVDVVTHAWRGVTVDVVRVILWDIPREDLKEGA